MTVNADVGRIYQVLENLIVNVLRYTPTGGTITLGGERMPDSIRLIVRDTGQGIAPKDLPSIFDRFWRKDPARTRAEGAGGGLGLAIARQLVLAHGGHIEVESQPGRGSTFLVHKRPSREQSSGRRSLPEQTQRIIVSLRKIAFEGNLAENGSGHMQRTE